MKGDAYIYTKMYWSLYRLILKFKIYEADDDDDYTAWY